MARPDQRAGAPDPGAPARRQPTGRRSDTRDPRRARERALKILFQADVRGEAADVLLARILDDPRAWAMLDDLDPEEVEGASDPSTVDADPDDARTAQRRRQLQLDGFTRSLVAGVATHRAEIDELVQRYARRWSVSRMPAIDRNLLRLGTYELLHETTSPAVVINEVIELAKRLSTEDSGRYVNGVLEAVRRHLADPDAGADPEADADPVAVADRGADPVEVVPDGAPSVDLDGAPSGEVVVEVELPDGALAGPVGGDLLPPPDEEGDAVDLQPSAEPEPDEPEDDDGPEVDDTSPVGGADQPQLF